MAVFSIGIFWEKAFGFHFQFFEYGFGVAAHFADYLTERDFTLVSMAIWFAVASSRG